MISEVWVQLDLKQDEINRLQNNLTDMREERDDCKQKKKNYCVCLGQIANCLA